MLRSLYISYFLLGIFFFASSLIIFLLQKPLKSADIDAVLAATRKEFEDLKTNNHRPAPLDDDLDSETKDLFVHVDNPEKHATKMEAYITFRVSTKARANCYMETVIQFQFVHVLIIYFFNFLSFDNHFDL